MTRILLEAWETKNTLEQNKNSPLWHCQEACRVVAKKIIRRSQLGRYEGGSLLYLTNSASIGIKAKILRL